MARQIVCPSCGESEDLNGSRTAEGIVVSCQSCKANWLRDSVPDTCATCGGTDIEFHPQALTQYARGTQVSIVGWRHGPFCVVCDAEVVQTARDGKPIPAAYISAAAKPRADGGTTGTLRILPESFIGER
ncbi:hypothetical protein [Nonomuraea diastatica]|uniref:hypothetical protein n=1 Tax=Nonomuraea diastatica TaxID=1848329 RepID=UPI0015F2E196|nr:hypothetical protein [Nonomuraea diastatica]